MTGCTGLVLAAGAGRRMGGPKSLLRDRDGTAYLTRSVRVLLDGGCAGVTVVLGAAATEARAVLEEDERLAASVRAVVATGWEEGMGASLRAGLESVAGGPAEAVLVSLVDLPDVGADVVERVLARAGGPGSRSAALLRTTYAGRPGHPVLLGRGHWAAVAVTARGDHGARDYFREHRPEAVECGDLATGRDVDRPRDLVD